MNQLAEIPESDGEAREQLVEKPSAAEVIAALHRESSLRNHVIPSTLIYGLSDLSSQDCHAIADAWQGLPSVFKHRVLRALNEASETMFELGFQAIARLSLADESPMVRSMAIDLLWADESEETMRRIMEAAARDQDSTVRANALKALGNFILLGEYGDIPLDTAKDAQDLTLGIHRDQSEPLNVRRRALEALANSSHPAVPALIRAAYDDGNHDLKISAIFAMGRTCSDAWRRQLLEELSSEDEECVYEAISACGRIQLADSVRPIAELSLRDDRELQMMAVWALGEIGGKQAFDVLTSLAEAELGDELAALVDEALDAAGFSLSFSGLNLDLENE